MKNLLKIEFRRLRGNILILVFMALICFTVLEIGFRVLDIGPSSDPNDAPFVKHESYNPYLVFGPNVNQNFEQIEGGDSVWNSQGFRMSDNLDRSKNVSEYRIFSLGGSTTENLPNGKNIHYPEELCKKLNNQSIFKKDIVCINSGKSGYSTAQSLIRFQFDILAFDPDMVILMHNINDLSVNFFPEKSQTNNYADKYLHEHFAKGFNFRNGILKKSRFATFTHDRIRLLQQAAAVSEVKENSADFSKYVQISKEDIEIRNRDAFKNNLIAFASIAKANNVTVVFLSQPATFSDEKLILAFGHKAFNREALYPKKSHFKELFEEYNKIIEETAEEQGVLFVDMNKKLGSDDKYFFDSFHYTDKGIYLFSEILAKELKIPLIKYTRKKT